MFDVNQDFIDLLREEVGFGFSLFWKKDEDRTIFSVSFEHEEKTVIVTDGSFNQEDFFKYTDSKGLRREDVVIADFFNFMVQTIKDAIMKRLNG